MERQVNKPTTQRGKRFLEHRAPKLVENCKQTMFMKGGRTSETVTSLMKDLYVLKKPNAVFMKRKNPFALFEDETPIEKFCQKYDASLFAFGCHSKKRPHNLIIGRLFDYHVLDLFEFGIENYISLKTMKVPQCSAGSKPCLVFSGEAFQKEPTYQRLKNLMIDFFRGEVVQKIRLQGLEHVICFTVMEGKVHVRCYRILLKKSGTRTPKVALAEMGPRFDLVLRRNKIASSDLFKQACKIPDQLKTKKVKNVSHDVFGTKLGRIHLGKQDLTGFQTRKVKALKGFRPRQAGTDSGSRKRSSGSGANSMPVAIGTANSHREIVRKKQKVD